MKKFKTYLAVFVSAMALAETAFTTPYPANAEVYFSPKGGAEEAIVKNIDGAKNNVYVEAFLFTNPAITDALLRAYKRGIDVKVIMDKKAALGTRNNLHILAKNKVPTYLDGAHKTAHNKVILIDGDKVLTGSFNFIVSSEDTNSENLLVANSKELADQYRTDWEKHLAHSVLVNDDELKQMKAKAKKEPK